MSTFAFAAFAGYMIVFTGVTLALYFGLRSAKII